MRTAIGVAFLLFQLVMIVYARFVPSRYFCWAPYDAQSEYSLQVTIDGRPLANQEIRRRYRRPQLPPAPEGRGQPVDPARDRHRAAV